MLKKLTDAVLAKKSTLGRKLSELKNAGRARVIARLEDPTSAKKVAVAVTLVTAALLIAMPASLSAFLLLLVGMLVVQRCNVPNLWKLASTIFVAVAVIPIAGMSYPALTFLCVQVFINIALALGLNLVVGMAGLLDLGYIAFFAGGAYIYAMFASAQPHQFLPESMHHLFPLGGWWFWLCIPIALGVAALLGLALGLPVLRLRGDYLAIVTLGFGEIIAVLARNLDHPINLTNGSRGIVGITKPVLFGIPLNKPVSFYFIGLVIVIFTLIAMMRLERSRTGRAWAAMREDEVAAKAMGINLMKYKLLAFMTGASFAGAMGMLFAVKQNFINPDSFTFLESIGILAMVILGGLGSIKGAIVGAIAVTVIRLRLLKEMADFVSINFDMPPAFNIAQYQPLIFGLILILMMIYRQQGMFPAKRPQEDIDKILAAPPAPTKGPSVGMGG